MARPQGTNREMLQVCCMISNWCPLHRIALATHAALDGCRMIFDNITSLQTSEQLLAVHLSLYATAGHCVLPDSARSSLTADHTAPTYVECRRAADLQLWTLLCSIQPSAQTNISSSAYPQSAGPGEQQHSKPVAEHWTCTLNFKDGHSLGGNDNEVWPPTRVVQLTNFGSWLSQYAGLVRSISINSDVWNWLWSDYELMRMCVAEPLLALGLRAATSQLQATAQPPQLLQLHSYSSDMLHGSAVLQALAGANVTRLNLKECSMASVAAALPHLPNLQSLQLAWKQVTDVSEDNMLAVRQHSGLTQLTLDNFAGDFTPQQLPAQLQELSLHCMLTSSDGAPANFGHLTRLTRLVVRYDVREGARYTLVYEGGLLPQQLEELQVDTPAYFPGSSAVRDLNITALQHLRKLTMKHSEEDAEELLALCSMPQLQQLALVCDPHRDEGSSMVARPVVWRQLQQLQSLEVGSDHTHSLPAAAFVSVVHNLTAVTWLTQLKLDLNVYADVEGPPETQIIGFCNQIAKLQNLQALELSLASDGDLKFVSGDAHHLSALVNCLDEAASGW